MRNRDPKDQLQWRILQSCSRHQEIPNQTNAVLVFKTDTSDFCKAQVLVMQMSRFALCMVQQEKQQSLYCSEDGQQHKSQRNTAGRGYQIRSKACQTLATHRYSAGGLSIPKRSLSSAGEDSRVVGTNQTFLSNNKKTSNLLKVSLSKLLQL